MMISTSPWQLDDPISRRVLHQLYLSILCHHGNGRVTESGSTYRSRVSQSLYSFCPFTVPRVLSFHKQYILPPYHFLSLYIYKSIVRASRDHSQVTWYHQGELFFILGWWPASRRRDEPYSSHHSMSSSPRNAGKDPVSLIISTVQLWLVLHIQTEVH